LKNFVFLKILWGAQKIIKKPVSRATILHFIL